LGGGGGGVDFTFVRGALPPLTLALVLAGEGTVGGLTMRPVSFDGFIKGAMRGAAVFTGNGYPESEAVGDWGSPREGRIAREGRLWWDRGR